MAREKVEHRIGIKASADTIWEILSDIEGWESWNPLYPKGAGVLKIGAQLDLILALPGKPSRPIKPTVIDWVPREQIHWKDTAFGGLVNTVRYMEIEALNEEGCVFSNGEIYVGMLAPHLVSRNKRLLRQAFTALGEALRDRAEAVWRERQPRPTSAA
jgi:hypothetical protein